MKPGAGLWIGVAVGFTLLAMAWTGLFFFASQARVKTVPLSAPVTPTIDATPAPTPTQSPSTWHESAGRRVLRPSLRAHHSPLIIRHFGHLTRHFGSP